jgi:hypothetical protein
MKKDLAYALMEDSNGIAFSKQALNTNENMLFPPGCRVGNHSPQTGAKQYVVTRIPGAANLS